MTQPCDNGTGLLVRFLLCGVRQAAMFKQLASLLPWLAGEAGM